MRCLTGGNSQLSSDFWPRDFVASASLWQFVFTFVVPWWRTGPLANKKTKTPKKPLLSDILVFEAASSSKPLGAVEGF